MTTRTRRFGTFDGDPAVFNEVEGWVLTNGVWHESQSFVLFDEAAVMDEAAFIKTFPGILKTLPKAAFTG